MLRVEGRGLAVENISSKFTPTYSVLYVRTCRCIFELAITASTVYTRGGIIRIELETVVFCHNFASLRHQPSSHDPAEVVAMTKPQQKSLVCVTGATGYIAMFIVRELLFQNYRVRATVRTLANHSKLQPLRALDPNSTKLELVELDMTDTSTFKPALSDCEALIHTATPIAHCTEGWSTFTSVEEAEKKQLKPAVEGTEALLRVASEVGICKVVLTSSTAAMMIGASPHPVLNEPCWADVDLARSDIMEQQSAAYRLAKTLQERLAWRLSSELGIRLVSINPCFVTGPSLSPHMNIVQQMLIDLCRGVQNCYMVGRPGTIPDAHISIVDVRDVARAHVLGLRDAEGRYMLLTSNVHYEDIWRVLREVDERFRRKELKLNSEDGRNSEPKKFDNSKAKGLGVCKIPWEETIREAGQSIIKYDLWPEQGD